MISDFLNSFINFIYSHLFGLEFLSVFISGIFLGLIVYFNISLGLTREKLEHWADVWGSEKVSERRSFKIWKQIKKRLMTREETQIKLAVLEADRILDEILKMASFPGDSLDDKLEKIDSSELPNIEELRQAHKIRDRIVSEPDFTITPGEAEIAIGIYRRAFIDLDLLDESD